MITNKDIYFIITRSCNYQCPFCIRENLKGNTAQMSYEKASIVMSRLKEIVPESTIIITGGEPVMHKHWELFVTKAMSLFKRVVLTSNGSFSTDIENRIIPLLSKNLWLQFSLDGTECVHDQLRGKGAYSKVIDKLKRLSDYGNHIVLSSTVGVRNINDIRNLAVELNNYSFSRWKITEELVIDPLTMNIVPNTEWNKMVDEVLPLCQFSVRVQKFFDFNLMEKFLNQYDPNKHHLITKCGSGTKTFSINPDFTVLACTCLDDTIGNIYEDDTENLLERLEHHCSMSPSEDSVCYSCKYKEICKGGCSGYSKKIFGKFNMGDIRCPKVNWHK